MNFSLLEEAMQLTNPSPQKKPKVMFNSVDNGKVWKFIEENWQRYGPFEIFTKMKDALGFEQAARSLYYRFRNTMAPNLHLTSFDVDTKLQLARKFNLCLNKEFLQGLSSYIDIELDSGGYVTYYTWKNGHAASSLPTSSSSTTSDMLMNLATTSDASIVKTEPNVDSGSSKWNSEHLEVPENTWPEDNSGLFAANSFFDTLKETICNSNREFIQEMKDSNSLMMTKMTELIAQSSTNQNLKITKKPPTSPPTDSNAGMKYYLEGLRGLLVHLNASELSSIEDRIKTLEVNLGDKDKPLPTESIYSMLDIGLKLIGG